MTLREAGLLQVGSNKKERKIGGDFWRKKKGALKETSDRVAEYPNRKKCNRLEIYSKKVAGEGEGFFKKKVG